MTYRVLQPYEEYACSVDGCRLAAVVIWDELGGRCELHSPVEALVGIAPAPIDAAFEEGRAALRSGKGPKANPYPSGELRSEAWRKGYDEALEVMR